MKIFAIITFIAISLFNSLFLPKVIHFNIWKVKNNSQDISWAKFEWVNEELHGKYFEKTAMLIPCKVDGIPNIVTFQFDLGANLTGVYENSLSSFYSKTPNLKKNIKHIKSKILFWNKERYFEDLVINFGDYTASNNTAYIYGNFGEKVQIQNPKDTIHLGTIGSDIFKDKVLIIDYPKKLFAICDNVPEVYNSNLVDIELDEYGRVILPMKIKDRNYRIMFDNGSSIFPLITKAGNISNFSTSKDIDTIQISSWGKIHGVTGKLITDTFQLAGQNFNNVKVYANHSGLGMDDDTDGMTGNALFWDRTIIIDFKNKKFGVK